MLQKEYNHLRKCIKKIQSATTGIYKILHKVFSMGDRSFMITIDENRYFICNPTTREEYDEQLIIRDEVIKKLIRIGLDNYMSNLECGDADRAMSFESYWDDILAMVMGMSKEEYQLEKIKEEFVDNNDNANIDSKKSKDLNYDSRYVQWQDQKQWENVQ